MLKKDLNYYKNLDYDIIVEVVDNEEEAEFMAYAKELGKYSCYGTGKTPLEAIENFLKEKDDFIEFLWENDKKIPEPQKKSNQEYSGVLTLRMPKTTHALLAEMAQAENVSINALINNVLASYIGKKDLELKILQAIENLENRMEQDHKAILNKISYRNNFTDTIKTDDKTFKVLQATNFVAMS